MNSLPPTLDATYARILRRVNESNHDVQIMVQRSLRWIAHAQWALDVAELCEAISVNPGDTLLDRDNIPAVEEILRRCSSLVRKSADGYGLEFAHFTVEEYLQKLDQVADNEFSAYHIQPEPCQIELAETCLTYLNLDDFGRVEVTDEEARDRRMKDYALRSYAVMRWRHHAEAIMSNERISPLIQQLFCPSKSSNFITWAQDYNVSLHEDGYLGASSDEFSFDTVNLRLATTGPLHYAAILAIPGLCTWLLHEGCEVNQRSPCGTPLQCTIFGNDALTAGKIEISGNLEFGEESENVKSTLITLLESGADPNCYYDNGERKLSLLGIVAYCNWKYSCLQLLRRGAVIDEYAKTQFRTWNMLAAEVRSEDLEEKGYASILERMLACDAFKKKSPSDSKTQVPKFEYGASIDHFRMAAKFGQLDMVTELLLIGSLDLNAAEIGTGRTALHYAAENGHSNIVTFLLAHGAESNVVDSDGRTPIFLATKVTETRCFLSLLRHGCDISVRDPDGCTPIHYAAMDGNIAALLALKERLDFSVASPCSRAVEGPTIPLYADLGTGREAEIIPTGEIFLQAISQKLEEGKTPLHLAVESGLLEVVRFLLDSNCDPNASMNDGSTALHCVAQKRYLEQSDLDIMNVLLEHRADPCHPRCDGATPLHLMIPQLCVYCTNEDISLEIFKTLACKEGTLLQTNAEGLTVLHLHLRQYSIILGSFANDLMVDTRQWAKVLTILLEAGAQLQAVDPQNRSALRYLVSALTDTTKYFSKGLLSQVISITIDHIGEDENLVKIVSDPALLVLAVKRGLSEVVQKLLDMSPQVGLKATTFPQMTPIQAACHYGCDRKNLLRLLELSNARSDPAGLGSDLLRLACQSKNTEAYASALVLLEAGLDPSNRSSEGENALMLAARAGNVDIVKLLIGHGANPSVSDAQGCNVAHYALDGGHMEVIYALRHCKLDWGAKGEMSINGKTLQDVTALHLAARHEDSTLLEYLINEKLISDIDCVTKDRVTPLYVAVWSEAPQNIAVLLSKNANACVMGDESPLHMATRFGDRDKVSQFLQHGCDVTIPNKDGLDCELIALKYGFKDLAQMIAQFAQKQGTCLFQADQHYMVEVRKTEKLNSW